MQRVQVIDTHTGGEPTRVVMSGGPNLGGGPLAERRAKFAAEFDAFRSAVANEPRGSDVMVGALLVPPVDPANAAGVVFFNNVGTLGMCGHGTIGVGVALAHAKKISIGTHKLETPVGTVSFALESANVVSLENVPAYRHAMDVAVQVPGFGNVVGDVAWGGNWFFLVYEHALAIDLANVDALTDFSWRVRQALGANGVTGANGGEIDHVELFGSAKNAENHSRNFVLCPGKAYDRSPCGTGTSAKIACLAADGKLKPGEIYRQESLIGSMFEASYRIGAKGEIIPRIRGSAYVNAESTLIFDAADPFVFGIRSEEPQMNADERG